jgi:NADPH:quinone reductase-like Zn-dependent oxidoreductase
VTVGPRKPLQVISLPTPTPKNNEVLVRVEWTASTPLDLHQADGGLLVNPPQVLGDGCAGTVVATGVSVQHLNVGDKVFGFTWRVQQEKAHQEYVLAPENLFGKVPDGMGVRDVVSMPGNFVTAFQSLKRDLLFELPWPKPDNFVPNGMETPVLVWGGSSSVGQYAIQILSYYGYKRILTAASRKHHELLKGLGASDLIDYQDSDAVEQIRGLADGQITRVLDCIGSLRGSIQPISKLAERGTIVAIMLPVIVVDAGENQAPEYEMDVTKERLGWKDGVEARGVRTHFYLDVS